MKHITAAMERLQERGLAEVGPQSSLLERVLALEPDNPKLACILALDMFLVGIDTVGHYSTGHTISINFQNIFCLQYEVLLILKRRWVDELQECTISIVRLSIWNVQWSSTLTALEKQLLSWKLDKNYSRLHNVLKNEMDTFLLENHCIKFK